MNTYRMRGQLKPLQEFNIRNEIQNLRNQIAEMEKQIKFEQNSKEKSRLETKLRDLQGQLRQAQAKLVIAGFRVEVWDDDEKFDDRLASGKTDSTGWFEYEFSEEDFRQQFLDLDWSPDLFFKVYQGRDPIGASQPRPNIPLPSDINVPLRLEPFELLTEDEKESGYRLENVTIQLLKNQEQEDRPRQAFQERAIAVYDILPTANQLVGHCPPSSPHFVDKNDCSLEYIVDCALAEILGRNLKNDPKAFVATLNKNFTAKVNNGYTEYEWSPQAYAPVQNDLGGTVSGAQASLYHRAKSALNDILPLLNKLYALNPAADLQNADAMREIIRTEAIELVNELGATGGPRIQRVDNLFQLIIGSAEDNNGSDRVGGQLKNLADVFGLNPDRVNTVDEEQNYGNFLIIRDYLFALRNSWNDYVENSEGGAYIGPQLVLLSQALSVVAESVQETYRIMELVFLGAAERQSLAIDFTKVLSPPGMPRDVAFPLPDGTGYLKRDLVNLVPPMTVEGLLTWVWRFGSEEGPALAKAGGKLGIAEGIVDTTTKLMILVQAASFTPVSSNAFRREGVLRALRDLAMQLYQVKELAKQIIPPSTNYEPDAIDQLPQRSSGSITIPMRRI
jgi:hypothetical protein